MKARLLLHVGILTVVSLVAGSAGAEESLSKKYGDWPMTSCEAVRPLAHPKVETKAAAMRPGPEAGYRFAFFGDQRALADGEWQFMLGRIRELALSDERLLFMADGGDIVHDGRYTDQFAFLARSILAPVNILPYLVAIGHHELRENDEGARRSVATFLSYLDPALSAERLYYRKDIGPVRFLFVDSNDFVYDDGHGGARLREQLNWLVRELAPATPAPPTTVVLMHHPLLQSSKEHADQAAAIWNLAFGGRRLADIFADGGVAAVLTGHTHTYERFTLGRQRDGRSFAVVNASGRPRPGFLWFGAGSRRARDIRGKEASYFAGRGYGALDQWSIRQDEAMLKRGEADQFAIVDVEASGGLVMRTHFIDLGQPGGFRSTPAVRLR
jgi:hypothetical protein